MIRLIPTQSGKLLLSFLCVFLLGCDKLFKDDTLTLQKKEIATGSLKLNGYYYTIYGNENKGSIYFFYTNGILQSMGDGFDFSKILIEEQKLTRPDFLAKIKKNKTCWGVVNIDASSIQFARWYNSEPPLKVYTQSGNIQNDSTFTITQSVRSDGEYLKAKSEVFHFRSFANKPDSTNQFVP